MKLTTSRVQTIVNTLPIGYYLKRQLEIELCESSSTSHINLKTEKITIAMANFKDAYDKLTVDDESLEKSIRAILYHELSHALLTPKELTITNVINIFEDERIETVLKDYYLDVDFKDNLRKIVNIDNIRDTSLMSTFFKLVRFRQGPPELLRSVNTLIFRHRHLNSSSGEYDTKQYEQDIYGLYRRLRRYMTDEKQKKHTQLQSESGESNKDNDELIKDSNDEHSESSAKTNSQSASVGQDDKLTTKKASSCEESEAYDEAIQTAIKDLHTSLDSGEKNEYYNELAPLLNQIRAQEKQTGSAISAYSGVFNPRSVSNENYKYFAQQNRAGNIKQYSNVQLNLFIDVSGSFLTSENTVNAFLRALMALEKEVHEFTFNVVTIGEGETLLKGDDRQIECTGGNAITNEIFKLSRELHSPETLIHNIALFDGDAFSHDVSYDIMLKSTPSNFSVFNSPNTHLLTNDVNMRYAKSYAPNAKTIYTNEYASKFKSTIISILQNIFR